MNLQIDVGNSFIKWRVLDAGLIVFRGKQKTASNSFMCDFEAWDKIESVSVSSVASQSVDRSLEQFLMGMLPHTTPFFAKSEASFDGVVSAYENPSQLGVDRWLAVIAGYMKYKESCFVVDCGSAITIDVVTGAGKHQGGYILPGLGLMKQSLSDGTKRVEFESDGGVCVKYGGTTSECVQAGVNFVMQSIVEGLLSRMEVERVDRLIVTGGDGAYASSLHRVVEYCPDLVLDGLSLVTGVSCGNDNL